MSAFKKKPAKSAYDKGLQKPWQFYRKNNEQYDNWDNVNIVILHERDQQNKSQCRKNHLYPNFPERPEFCNEEFLAYRWFRGRKLQNDFTKRCDAVWKEILSDERQKETTESLEFSIEGAGCVELEKMKDRENRTLIVGTSSQVFAIPDIPKKKKTQNKKKTNVTPIPVLEYHHNENVPFAKPKSPMLCQKSGINSQKTLNKHNNKPQSRTSRSPFSSIQNTLKTVKSSVKSSVASMLTEFEAFESLSIHRGSHVAEHRNINLLDVPSENFPESNKESTNEEDFLKSASYPSSINSLQKLELNPFDSNFIKKLIEKNRLVDRLKQLGTCTFKEKVTPLAKGHTIGFGGEEFCVVKCITKGGYGTIYSAKSKITGETFALKQERPPNVWEYYLCLELQQRIQDREILSAFIPISYGLIGDNISILALPFSRFGSLVDVNNLLLRVTNRCSDEIIVFCIAKQLLTIFQYLHQAQILHADVKADNFLVINEIESPSSTKPFIQLIDFGFSIDLKLIKQEDPHFSGFTRSLKKNPCIEMREDRPWIYQLDWYGVAGTIHAMLFGEYMKVKQERNGLWMPQIVIRRYFRQKIWKNLFEELLNIRGESEQHFQNLIDILDEELAMQGENALKKIEEFNKIICSNGK